LKVKVDMTTFMLYPDPAAVTVIPLGPWLGVKVSVGTVTVKVADAVSPVTVATSLPDATTVFAPADDDGTVNVHVNVPVALVVCDVHVWVPGVVPLKVNFPIAVLTENPLPVTVTLLPLRP